MDAFLFDLRGYLILENAVEPALIEALNAQFDEFPRDLERGGWYRGAQRRDYDPRTGMELHNCLEIGGAFEQLIDHPSWISHLRHFTGENGTYVEGLFIDECIASVRNSGGYHPIHSGNVGIPLRCLYHYQDGRFRCGQINVIVALTDIGEGDGPTILVPGSHKANLPYPLMQDHGYGGDKGRDLPAGAVAATMKKGDALLFTDSIIHGGIGRTNEGERRVTIFRYGPSWARTRFNYQYSNELLARLPLERRLLLEPIPPCPDGADFIPVEAPVYAKAQRQSTTR